MSIGAISAGAAYTPQVRAKPAVERPAATPAFASVGRDSDGDNDGTKGGTVDVRA